MKRAERERMREAIARAFAPPPAPCLHPSGCAEPRAARSPTLCDGHARDIEERAAAFPVHPPVDPREYHAEFEARESRAESP